MHRIKFRLWCRDARTRLRALALLCLFAPLAAVAQSRSAAEVTRVTVGALRFTSSGPLFLARERGYFAAERLEVEIRFFEAAPTIAVAVATGDLTFGSAALTAAFYNLAADGKLVIVAGQAREERGYPGNLILVTRRAYDAGVTELRDLFAQPFGLTQHGSPSHYQLGQLARAHAVPMGATTVRAFQTLPNLVVAMRADRVTWAIIAPPIAQDLVTTGAAVSLGRFSDNAGFQFGAIFAQRSLVEERTDMVRRFLRGYRRGIADYAALYRASAGQSAEQAERAREAAILVARHVYPDDAPEDGARKVLASAFFVDPAGGVDEDDVARQVDWYVEQGLVRRLFDVSSIMRLDLLRAE